MALKGLELLSREKEIVSKEPKINSCPVCGLNGGNGALCERHAEMTKDFKWLSEYINNTEKFDNKTLYLLNFAISDRVSLVINDIDVVEGRLVIKEYLDEKMEKGKCSLWMERVLKEILSLQKAKGSIMKIMSEGGS